MVADRKVGEPGGRDDAAVEGAGAFGRLGGAKLPEAPARHITTDQKPCE